VTAANTAAYTLLTPKQVSEKLQVSVETLKNWRDNGTGPRHIKLGGQIRYRSIDLETYLNENTRASTQG
jgi:predicted DNA-binding transcriptional regulator AlpA